MLSEHELKGYSMYPLLKPGQRVVLDLNKKEILKGDIVAFFVAPEKLVFHRVLNVEGGLIYCKGDSNSFVDLPIINGDVFGVLKYVRTSETDWEPASKYQKAIYRTVIYGKYAQISKRFMFLAKRVIGLLPFK